MRVLNIAYFLSVATDYLGGADHTLFMQAVLMKSRHNVVVVLPCGKDGKTNEKFQKKCEAVGLAYEMFVYEAAISVRSINLADYKRDMDRLEHFVMEKQLDILHSVQINPVIEYISRKCRVPHVMNIYSLEDWEWKIPCPDIFPQYVSCDSEYYLKKWMEYINCRGKCIRVYDDVGIKKQVPKDKMPVVIGAAGLVFEHKNYLEVIKAVECIIKKGRKVRFLLAGEDSSPYAACCRDYIKQHQLHNYIQLLGFVDNMREFFGMIDVFICGSRQESFPASIVEAFSCNIPVISTPVAGVPEILADRENAYLSRGYSADEVAEAIEYFLEDYGNGALGNILAMEEKTYWKFFSAEAVKKQLEDLYAEMLNNMAETKRLQDMAGYEEKIGELIKAMEREGLGQEDIRIAYDRLLYVYQIKDIISRKRCYIWGAGRWGNITRVILKCLIEDIEVMAFVDETRTRVVDGIKVIKKEEMNIQKDTAVLISFVRGQEEAVAYLMDKNMEIMKNIFIVA